VEYKIVKSPWRQIFFILRPG